MTARQVAFRVLELVEKGGFASDLLRRETENLSARDAGLAEAIVMGSLRYQAQLDFLIAHYSGRGQKLDPEVRIALRMGIYQLRYLDRIPAHAAVAETVELVKRAHKRSAAPFVNAVLRKVDRAPVAWPDRATELSIPAWMLERWERQYGDAPAENIARAALEQPQACINPETGREQDIGAQSIVPLLAIEPGMSDARLVRRSREQDRAGDRRRSARHRLRSFLSRLAGVPGARVSLDATTALPFGNRFDRILIDAPCSGTGTLARNPEIKWRLKPADLARFEITQRAILNQAVEFVKPGGRLVYSTCSLEREENEA